MKKLIVLLSLVALGVVVKVESVLAQGCDGECDEPVPSPVVKTLDLGKDGPYCGDNHFYVNAVARINGVEQSGVEVTFKYKSETVKKKTNSQGRAEHDMPFKGDDQVSAEAGGYPSQSLGVDSKAMDDCPAPITKMAETSEMMDQVVKLMLAGGMLLIVAGASIYAVKKN